MDPTKKNPDDRVYVGGDVNYVPGGVQRPCTKCGTPAWISPAGQRFLMMTPIPVVCIRCGAQAVQSDDDPKVEPCPGSLEELRNYFRRN